MISIFPLHNTNNVIIDLSCLILSGLIISHQTTQHYFYCVICFSFLYLCHKLCHDTLGILSITYLDIIVVVLCVHTGFSKENIFVERSIIIIIRWIHCGFMECTFSQNSCQSFKKIEISPKYLSYRYLQLILVRKGIFTKENLKSPTWLNIAKLNTTCCCIHIT